MKYTGSFNPLQFQMMQVSVVTAVWLLSCLPVRDIDLRSREGKMWQGREKQLELDGVSENERDRERRVIWSLRGIVNELATNCFSLLGDN